MALCVGCGTKCDGYAPSNVNISWNEYNSVDAVYGFFKYYNTADQHAKDTVCVMGYALGYGDSNSSWLSERVGVSEMWGYFAEGVLEQYCWNHYYSHPVNTFYYGEDEWFKPGILYEINEHIPSISAAEVLDCLRPGVDTFISFRDAIINHTHYCHHVFIEDLFSELCE